MRIDGTGFSYRTSLTNPIGGVVGEPGQPVLLFSAQGNTRVSSAWNYPTPKGGVCVGSDWCATQCSANGPYYLLPFIDRLPRMCLPLIRQNGAPSIQYHSRLRSRPWPMPMSQL